MLAQSVGPTLSSVWKAVLHWKTGSVCCLNCIPGPILTTGLSPSVASRTSQASDKPHRQREYSLQWKSPSGDVMHCSYHFIYADRSRRPKGEFGEFRRAHQSAGPTETRTWITDLLTRLKRNGLLLGKLSTTPFN